MYENAPNINSCRNNIIKCSKNSIVYFYQNIIYKQYPLYNYKWVNEISIVNYLNQTINNTIIKFIKCEIIDDYVVDVKNKEICLDKKETVVRISMTRYDTTLNTLSEFTDTEIFFILNNLLKSLLLCKSRNVLHRDIKERNILINYKILSADFSSISDASRIITDVILADFNISKYNISKNNKRYDIMTATHRSPEIWSAIYNKQYIEYDERIDVWAFCIVLSFLLTSQTFFNYLSTMYIKSFPSILYDVSRLKLALDQFLYIYTRRKIIHIHFFKKIIDMGITIYKDRCTFDDIYDELIKYTNKLNNNNIPTKLIYNENIMNTTIIDGYESNLLYKILENSTWINYYHKTTKNEDIILTVFYKNLSNYFYNNTLFYNKLKFLYESRKLKQLTYFLLSLYILIAYILNEEYHGIDYYMEKINSINMRDNTLGFNKSFKVNTIHKSIINLIIINKFNIIY